MISIYIILFLFFVFSSRTAGSILGAGFDAFISDWDKISATVRIPFYYIIILIAGGTPD